MSPLLLNLAHPGDVDLDLVANVKKERAWVLQSPFNVWNGDVGPGAKTVSFGLNGQGESKGMIGPVESEDTINLHIGISLKLESAGHFGGRKSNLGVALTFEDFRVHFVVAARISAVSTGSIHDYQAAGRAA